MERRRAGTIVPPRLARLAPMGPLGASTSASRSPTIRQPSGVRAQRSSWSTGPRRLEPRRRGEHAQLLRAHRLARNVAPRVVVLALDVTVLRRLEPRGPPSPIRMAHLARSAPARSLSAVVPSRRGSRLRTFCSRVVTRGIAARLRGGGGPAAAMGLGARGRDRGRATGARSSSRALRRLRLLQRARRPRRRHRNVGAPAVRRDRTGRDAGARRATRVAAARARPAAWGR